MTTTLDVETTTFPDDLDDLEFHEPQTTVPPAIAKLAPLLAESYARTPLFA